MADDTHGVPGTSQFQFNFGADTSGSMLGMGSTYYLYPSTYGYYGPCLGSQVQQPFSKSSSTVSSNTAVDLTHEQEVRSYFLFKAQIQMKLFLLLGVQQRVQLQSSYHKP